MFQTQCDRTRDTLPEGQSANRLCALRAETLASLRLRGAAPQPLPGRLRPSPRCASEVGVSLSLTLPVTYPPGRVHGGKELTQSDTGPDPTVPLRVLFLQGHLTIEP